ncbi:unnamed protein product, partial [Rotaria sp. Silwood1]
ILLKYKHYLQNRYRKTKLENDRLDLRLWSKITKQETLNHKARQWNSFLSKLASPNPKTFWNHVKLLNKKPKKGFSGITDDDNMNIYKTPASILLYLQQHFENRFASPNLDISNKTDINANDLWQRLTTVKNDNSIQEQVKYSNLTFTTQDLHSIIKSLANKKFSSFDRISNQMIKLVPTAYYPMLINNYNKLFASARWDRQWKCSRLLCFNKVLSPVPKTSQLRPINLLSVFSKIYEKLFLLRFHQWLNKANILPSQQSGSRQHQSTATRVQYLLQQLTQSSIYNSTSTVVYIDFLQAYDKLWQQGFLLKLSYLECPLAYMQWITNYFLDRSCIIDIDEHLSQPIHIKSGVPQDCH